MVEVGTISPVDEVHPTGIVQEPPAQSIGIVHVSVGAVVVETIDEMIDVALTAPVVIPVHPAGMAQVTPVQSLGIVQVSAAGVVVEATADAVEVN